MKPKFTTEADDIIRKFYPTRGTRRTMDELEKLRKRVEQEAISLCLDRSQVQQRARTLHIKSVRSSEDLVQRYEAGETVAIYQIKEFLGIKRTGVPSGGYVQYLVQCVVCGHEQKKRQNGLYQSEQRDTKACSDCSRIERVEREALRVKEETINAAQLRKSYAKFMRDMPRVPVKYLPHSKRIDSQRSARL